jgi:hypothetical protein
MRQWSVSLGRSMSSGAPAPSLAPPDGDPDRLRNALDASARAGEAARTGQWYPNFIAESLAKVGDRTRRTGNAAALRPDSHTTLGSHMAYRKQEGRLRQVSPMGLIGLRGRHPEEPPLRPRHNTCSSSSRRAACAGTRSASSRPSPPGSSASPVVRKRTGGAAGRGPRRTKSIEPTGSAASILATGDWLDFRRLASAVSRRGGSSERRPWRRIAGLTSTGLGDRGRRRGESAL